MGATTDLVMPKLGLTMTEGRLAEWRVKPGERVKSGAVLFVVETDKIANEVEAPGDGTVTELVAPEGAVLPVGAVVARWTGPALVAPDGAPSAADDGPAHETEPARPARLPTANGRVVATPLARRLARTRGVELSQIRGSGPRGRIKACDVAAADARPASTARSVIGQGRLRSATRHEDIAARRLTRAVTTVPHFHIAAEAEVGQLMVLREGLTGDATRARPTLTHFILAAVARALADLPAANSIWLDDGILIFDSVDVGLAVQTDQGLLAPVLRDLAGKALDDIAAAADTLVARARHGKLGPDDLSGGAVTVSNLGMHGISQVIPIINPPQAAILGVGRVQGIFRPDRTGAPCLRHEMILSLAADHRVLDGVAAAALLRRIIGHLEAPTPLLRAAIAR